MKFKNYLLNEVDVEIHKNPMKNKIKKKTGELSAIRIIRNKH